jgi:membrane glycosyltransferase
MPTQSLESWNGISQMLNSSPRGIFWRRLFVIGGAAAMTAEAAHEMYNALGMTGLSVPEAVVLALYVALFGWIAFAFTTAVGGCISLLFGRKLHKIDFEHDAMCLTGRTALLMPTYNESPARVMATLQAIFESLKSLGIADHFHIFIISDTTDPNIWIAEEASFLRLRHHTGAHEQIFYRRRPKNTERKSGNIADWVKRFGGAYPQMLVLDADSVMTGEAILRLSAALERYDTVGLIQSLPVIVNGTTLFARAQQFASRVYGPVVAEGLSWWQGAEGNYWGHNAVIRVKAFAEAAGLPLLRGRRPFGGAIMSHDFVEAALLRRSGWAVHLIPGLRGSYEESPPSLPDLAVRDRRWCQGNLQHSAILLGRGLHWVGRLNLFAGIGAYVTSPLWLLFLIAGVLLSLQSRFIRPQYFSAGPSLFPDWPHVDPVRAEWVLIGTLGVLLAPKFLGFLVLLMDAPARRGCGGATRALASILIETFITGLIAPIAMLSQSIAVTAILVGRDSGWTAQRRGHGHLSFRNIWCTYIQHTIFGLVFAVTTYLVSPFLFLWMMPVVLGLALAIPLAVVTAQPGVGLAARNLRLLQTPEERSPPAILVRAAELFESFRENETLRAVPRLLADRRLLSAHTAMLPLTRPKGGLETDLIIGLARLEEAENAAGAESHLSEKELVALLGDRRGVDRLIAAAQLS